MRILDKNTDFYDFYQNVYRDDSITFDRTDSFLLTKELMCEQLYWVRNRFHTWKEYPQVFVLLQICNTFWLFLLEVTKSTETDRPTEYSIRLVTTWKNYNKQRCLIKRDIIDFGWEIARLLWKHWVDRRYQFEEVVKRSDIFVSAIDQNDFRIDHSINKHMIYKGDGTKAEKHIPLLKACGIANCIDPLDVFLAFEEYFSLEKTSTERTASIGLTDEEKIGNHGFDKKSSFRGKTRF